MYESHRTLTKHKGRNDEKSQLFLNQLEELFYIAHQEAAEIVQCDKLRNTKQKEDLKFLDALKDGKKVVLGSVDKENCKVIKKGNNQVKSTQKKCYRAINTSGFRRFRRR